MTTDFPVLYVPSFYGDIRLERLSEGCKVVVEKLSEREKQAVEQLLVVGVKKDWIRPVLTPQQNYTFNAPLHKVQKVLMRLLKPGRETVTVVKFTNGTMEEIIEAPYEPGKLQEHPYRENALVKTEKPAPVAAATVATPTRGCPEPDFVKAEIKARGVLEVFLDAQQLADFRRHNRFITYGVVTGHRYMVTSRFARDSLAEYHRSLYDLDEHMALCVHDYTVPAAEEMLALHLLLQLPRFESYLRHLETV